MDSALAWPELASYKPFRVVPGIDLDCVPDIQGGFGYEAMRLERKYSLPDGRSERPDSGQSKWGRVIVDGFITFKESPP